MSSLVQKRPTRAPLLLLTLAGAAGLGYFATQQPLIGSLALLAFLALALYAAMREKQAHEELGREIAGLSHRVGQVGAEALLEMPIGILLLNEEGRIEWANPFVARLLDSQPLLGAMATDLADNIAPLLKSDELGEVQADIRGRLFQVIHKPREKLLYLFDVTEQVEIEKLYRDDRTVIAILLVDNYDDLASGMDDSTRSSLNSLITRLVNNWGAVHGIYIKRIASDRFLAILNEAVLRELEKTKFTILDEIREATSHLNMPLTLSIGVGASSTSLLELGQLAQSSLDLVLGRGGDQVAIKQSSGKVKFYGGKTNPVEKRTRVRARVISHALRDLIQDSDKVLVMGHQWPDMDAIGASVGVRKMAEMNQVDGYVIIDFEQLDSSVMRLMEEIRLMPELFERFISPEDALSRMTERTLLVVVDTHKPAMVIDEKLLARAEKVVILDHHRRGEEFIENPLLVYMEPYASSTAELVTELLEYQPKHEKLNMLEATSMLAGIVVDTKSFTLRTGARTFEAASYLRTQGADTVLVQRLMKEDLLTYIDRSKIVETAEFFQPGIAIAQAQEGEAVRAVLVAQAADVLLTLKDVQASFVAAKRSEGVVGISARSLGEVNVQVIMEKLGGGGHLTNAACQLPVDTIEEAIARLKQAINEATEGGKRE